MALHESAARQAGQESRRLLARRQAVPHIIATTKQKATTDQVYVPLARFARASSFCRFTVAGQMHPTFRLPSPFVRSREVLEIG
jgi:hypothetical protein